MTIAPAIAIRFWLATATNVVTTEAQWRARHPDLPPHVREIATTYTNTLTHETRINRCWQHKQGDAWVNVRD